MTVTYKIVQQPRRNYDCGFSALPAAKGFSPGFQQILNL
jgi:hypothetical protein